MHKLNSLKDATVLVAEAIVEWRTSEQRASDIIADLGRTPKELRERRHMRAVFMRRFHLSADEANRVLDLPKFQWPVDPLHTETASAITTHQSSSTAATRRASAPRTLAPVQHKRSRKQRRPRPRSSPGSAALRPRVVVHDMNTPVLSTTEEANLTQTSATATRPAQPVYVPAPPVYLWGGFDYLFKMTSDIDFLASINGLVSPVISAVYAPHASALLTAHTAPPFGVAG